MCYSLIQTSVICDSVFFYIAQELTVIFLYMINI